MRAEWAFIGIPMVSSPAQFLENIEAYGPGEGRARGTRAADTAQRVAHILRKGFKPRESTSGLRFGIWLGHGEKAFDRENTSREYVLFQGKITLPRAWRLEPGSLLS